MGAKRGAKQDGGEAAEVSGTVLEELPSLLYRVRLDSGHTVAAAATGRYRMDFLRLLPGSRVRLRLSPRDATRARIVGRVEQ
ncbi:MAG: translation initiation factor IF-1 [Bryobacterales bacterium]|nr:translation initiation factor IF-1 [Bryobacterales bacterium]MDE0261755.1 translation initiation factor IF-1 [Bryobacterales bacterium]MDE0623912.1 translation initiation factor IF-1 [Bryobacterales bacterium]